MLAAFPSYAADLQLSEDPEWGFFHHVLLPSPFESLALALDKRIYALRESGEDLTAARPVSAKLAFRSASERGSCLDALGELGEGVSLTLEEPRGEGASAQEWFVALLEWEASLSEEVFSNRVLGLFNHLAEHGGELWDWDCPAAE